MRTAFVFQAAVSALAFHLKGYIFDTSLRSFVDIKDFYLQDPQAAAILAAAENGLPVFEYAPTRIKQATVGRGGAGKNQVAFMVRALLALTETPDADAADALAIGLTHLRSAEAARLGVPGGIQI